LRPIKPLGERLEPVKRILKIRSECHLKGIKKKRENAELCRRAEGQQGGQGKPGLGEGNREEICRKKLKEKHKCVKTWKRLDGDGHAVTETY